MTESIEKIYDDIPYGDEPIRATDIGHLAAVGTLLGISAPDPYRSRILELGCAKGGNLLSLASIYPQAQFIGIDLSENQIQCGKNNAAGAGLKNVELRKASILDVDSSWGNFDYILAHGILSWVPQAVQEKIFDIYAKNLAPNGIGYVSYNTFPGWHLRLVLRDYMMLEANKKTSTIEKAKAARETLQTLQQCIEGDEAPASKCYLPEIAQMIQMPDWYFLHDFISEFNQPFYFSEIVKMGQHRGLQYLADSDVTSMVRGALRPALKSALQQAGGDHIRLEHLMDFSLNRMFRRTLLCRAELPLKRPITPAKILESYIRSPMKQAENQPTNDTVRFTHKNGGGIETQVGYFQKALIKLGQIWPDSLFFSELAGLVGLQKGSAETTVLAEQFLRCFFANLIELKFHNTAFGAPIPSVFRPVAGGLVRYQATKGVTVSTMLHESYTLNPAERQILPLCDGTRTVAELFMIVQSIKDRTLHISSEAHVKSVIETLRQAGVLK